MLKVFNTLTRKKEIFKPFRGKKVNMFVCGQTVYDDAHLGHAKTYVNFDIIVRWLRYKGFKVFYVQNITDIDDKIINRAKEKNVSPFDLAEYYTKRFLEDMERIGVKQNINLFPKSSEYIEPIFKQIQQLIDKGYAYLVDGDVYYDVSKFKDYTKLSRMSLEELKKHRIEPDPRKRNSYDFSLWKSAKEGEPSWEGAIKVNGNKVLLKGRPGWHIEDTAITITLFGPQYDLHGGATELIFPHHTNEIAQAEAATGKKPFVKYWLHSGILTIKGEKMSKSLKNFITIREILEKYDAEVLRMYYASTHYRKPLNYDESHLVLAKERLEKLYNTLRNLLEKTAKDEITAKEKNFMRKIEKYKKKFEAAMDDDFNTPKALSILFAFCKDINKFLEKNKTISYKLKLKLASTLRELGGIFGILQKEIGEEKIPEEAMKLIEERERLRKKGDYAAADAVRERLRREFGIVLEDTPEGVKWKKLK
ncbi:MAG: cysteine--tRNA ligase [Candidatus Aenigmatarchaeota archaeon]